MPRSWADTRYLQGAPAVGGGDTPATANGNGTVIGAGGVDQSIIIEVKELNGGTATLNFEGALDSANGPWYAVGYQRVDNQATLTRAVAAVSVTANLSAIYQILDPYPNFRARITAIAGSGQVVAKAVLIGT